MNGRIPPPLSSPGHPGRSKRTVTCEWCGRTYHPWPSNEGRFCTRECWSRKQRSQTLPRPPFSEEAARALAELQAVVEKEANDER